MHNQTYSTLITKSGARTVVRGSLPSGRKALGGTLRDVVTGFLDAVSSWRATTRSRYDLAQLNDRMLSDIGIDRAAAEREASTPFWR